MNIDLTRLKSGVDEYAIVDLNYSFSKEQLENSGILKLDNILIKGNITYQYDTYHLDLKVIGTMTLPCSVSLKPVILPLNIIINDDLDDLLEENVTNVENMLDIFPIIWENILMEIPLRVVSEDLSDVLTKGDGWQLITDKEEIFNPVLDKLKDLL
ncbi:MAG: DUF177 domain-containing protein [Bacilli bacterium]